MENVSLFQVVSAGLAIILLVDISVLWLTGKQVPALLSELVMGVFITYFASGFARSREARPRKATPATPEEEQLSPGAAGAEGVRG